MQHFVSLPLLPFLKRNYAVLLVLLWLLVQLWLYQKIGVKVVLDSHRYLLEGKAVAAKNFLAGFNSFSYIGYIYFIAAFFKLNIALEGVIFVQVLLSGIAAVCVHQIISRISGSWFGAFTGTGMFITWPDLQCWNFYIHTESLLISVSLFYTWLFFRNQVFFTQLLLVVLLIIVISIRPNGIIMAGASVAYLLGVQVRNKKFLRNLGFALPFLIVGGGLLVNWLLHNLKNTFAPIPHYNAGFLIGGFPGWAIDAPRVPYIPDPETSPILQIWHYVAQYPFYFFKLAFFKFLVFFAQVKPYYSFLHNLTFILIIYPCYYLFIIGMFYRNLYLPIRFYLLTAVFLQALITAFTMPDWDNRFMAPVLPFIFILGFAYMGKILQNAILFNRKTLI